MSLILKPNQEIVPGCKFTWKDYALLPQWKELASPTSQELENAKFLFTQLYKYIRQPLGKALYISSGARTTAYTKFLRAQGTPAALQSAHNEWKAVDLRPPAGMTNAQFWHWCDARWPGRMENLEATPHWVHLDTREWGKRRRFNP